MFNQLLQEVEQPEQEEQEEDETGIKKGGNEKQKDDGEVSKGENPLEKYMKIVLEAREKQHAQVSFTEMTETTVQLCFYNRFEVANVWVILGGFFVFCFFFPPEPWERRSRTYKPRGQEFVRGKRRQVTIFHTVLSQKLNVLKLRAWRANNVKLSKYLPSGLYISPNNPL